MTHITCRVTTKNRDQLRNPTLGNRVWAGYQFVAWSCNEQVVYQMSGFDLQLSHHCETISVTHPPVPVKSSRAIISHPLQTISERSIHGLGWVSRQDHVQLGPNGGNTVRQRIIWHPTGRYWMHYGGAFTCTPWGRKREPIFLRIHRFFNIWQELVNFFHIH